MNNRNHDEPLTNPWVGESSSEQWKLWRAGNEWAAKTGWVTLPEKLEEPSDSINQVDDDKS